MTVRRGGRLGIVVVVLAAMMVLAPPSYACACGAAIAPAGAQATMNHEVALVHWDGTTENILMRLAMNSSTDNVALVVPTPTPAIVSAGDKAAFSELEEVSSPQIQHQRHLRLKMLLGARYSASHEGAMAARAPEVINQVHLGPLEATTLAGGDLAGLQKWLADNEYAIRPEVAEALDPYVRDGWAFVAMRLTSAAPIQGGLDPVRLTFGSSHLVYPMRLSVAAQEPQHVTVFTLSDHRQQRADADAAGQTTTVQFAGNVGQSVHEPLLREFAGNHGAYLTKTQTDIYQTSKITSDFTFANAPNDDAFRQVIVVNDYIDVPIELIVLAALLIAVVTVVIVLLLRTRRVHP